MFNYVFDESETQTEVYKKTTLERIKELFEHKSSLIFTYGVTSSGKTYTCFGDENNMGVKKHI
jgi:type II secretory ATPase GspE/PulE/Tfp pilus assembly ATPase PilB-like protein